MSVTKLTYTEHEDGLLYPDLIVPPQNTEPLSRFGRARKTYLKEHKGGLYQIYLIKGELNNHLHEIDDEAMDLYESLIKKLKAEQGVTEQLKMDDQLLWVQMMNNICNQAREIVLDELIYV